MTHAPPTVDTSYAPANWSTDRAGNRILAIVAHGTGGKDSRAYLKRGGERPDGSDRMVSIHVLINKAGVIYRMVDDARGANHAGFGTMPQGYPQVNPNLITLGFELENLQDGKDPYPDAQLLAMGWQILQWRTAHGPIAVLRHADLDPTRRRDPLGLGVSQIEAWVRRARDYYGLAAQPYTVLGVPVYQRQDLTGTVAGYLKSDAIVDVDMTYPNGACHLASGLGFVDGRALEARP